MEMMMTPEGPEEDAHATANAAAVQDIRRRAFDDAEVLLYSLLSASQGEGMSATDVYEEFTQFVIKERQKALVYRQRADTAERRFLGEPR